jgi:threonine/homoserine/homoserine lactone efflux protein
VSGLGAASADAIYGSIAGFGLAFISNFLVSQQLWLRLAGGVFLFFLGIRTLLAKPAEQASSGKEGGLLVAYGSTFFLTLTNPMTIISFAAIFAGLGLASTRANYGSAGILVLGVFCGSTSWWLLLSGVIGSFRTRFKPAILRWVNIISGAVIIGFGIFAIVSIL